MTPFPTQLDLSLPLAAIFPASTCQVEPENVGVLTLFGNGLAIGVALSILTGKTYYRRVIAKDEEPFNYWLSVGCLIVLAVFVLGMLHACPHR